MAEVQLDNSIDLTAGDVEMGIDDPIDDDAAGAVENGAEENDPDDMEEAASFIECVLVFCQLHSASGVAALTVFCPILAVTLNRQSSSFLLAVAKTSHCLPRINSSSCAAHSLQIGARASARIRW